MILISFLPELFYKFQPTLDYFIFSYSRRAWSDHAKTFKILAKILDLLPELQ